MLVEKIVRVIRNNYIYDDHHNRMSNTLAVTAVDGGYLIIKLHNKEIVKIYVPPPHWEDKYRDSINSTEDYFADDVGNGYDIQINSAMGDIFYEIEISHTEDQDACNDFANNVEVIFEPIIPEEYSYEQIETAYEKRQRWTRELIENNLFEVSIIINVSSLETLMKDLFISNHNYWFSNYDSLKTNENILSILKNYNLNKYYLQNLWKKLGSNQTLKVNLLFDLFIDNINGNISIKINEIFNRLTENELRKNEKIDLLFDTVKKNLQNISFQKRKGEGSFNWLFKKIFDIDIAKFLDQEKIENISIRKHFDKMYELRHKLAHGVDGEYEVSKEDAELYFNVTKKVNEFLLAEVEKLIKQEHMSTFTSLDIKL